MVKEREAWVVVNRGLTQDLVVVGGDGMNAIMVDAHDQTARRMVLVLTMV